MFNSNLFTSLNKNFPFIIVGIGIIPVFLSIGSSIGSSISPYNKNFNKVLETFAITDNLGNNCYNVNTNEGVFFVTKNKVNSIENKANIIVVTFDSLQ